MPCRSFKCFISSSGYYSCRIPTIHSIDSGEVTSILSARENKNIKRHAQCTSGGCCIACNSHLSAALSPPGGVWQDDYNPDTNDHQFNTTALGIIINEVSPSSPHNAGTVVMGLDFFRILLFFNSATFYLTIMIIGVLLPIGFTGGMLFLPLGLLFLCYIISMSIISPSPISTILILFFCYVVLFLPVSFGSWGKRRRKLVQVFLPVVRLLDPTFT